MTMNATYPTTPTQVFTRLSPHRHQSATLQSSSSNQVFTLLTTLGKEVLAWSAAYLYMIAVIALIGWIAS